jgi:wyosine [tRNA(Phe)-imidazoG37] synthetase (radical SAM superfamily)
MGTFKCVFGPIQSRRLGLSLGVDLLPFKTCVYCECGATTNLTLERREYAPTAKVLEELDEALAAGAKPDFITFSGAGEPTLHSGIGRIIAHIKREHPSCKICLLTNSSLLPEPGMMEELEPLDLIVPSLDGSNQEEFERITRPVAGLRLDAVAEAIARLKRTSKAAMWLEIFIVPGVNDSLDSAKRFKELVARIAPDKTQLNSIDRPGTENWVRPPSPESMELLAKIIGEAAPVEIVGRRPGRSAGKPKLSADELNRAIGEMLLRRPCTELDVAQTLDLDLETSRAHLKRMTREGLLTEEPGERGLFYRLAKSSAETES